MTGIQQAITEIEARRVHAVKVVDDCTAALHGLRALMEPALPFTVEAQRPVQEAAVEAMPRVGVHFLNEQHTSHHPKATATVRPRGSTPPAKVRQARPVAPAATPAAGKAQPAGTAQTFAQSVRNAVLWAFRSKRPGLTDSKALADALRDEVLDGFAIRRMVADVLLVKPAIAAGQQFRSTVAQALVSLTRDKKQLRRTSMGWAMTPAGATAACAIPKPGKPLQPAAVDEPDIDSTIDDGDPVEAGDDDE